MARNYPQSAAPAAVWREINRGLDAYVADWKSELAARRSTTPARAGENATPPEIDFKGAGARNARGVAE
ncbi:MAG TPA: hypothetical protein VGM07_05175 [Stellaceae bacterium]|jgi:hypothetical protein